MSRTTIPASHANIEELASKLHLPEAAYLRALSLAQLSARPADWERHFDQFLIAIGTLLIVAGVTAFFAWNWADLGYMSKFALIEAAIVGTAILAWRLGLDTGGGKSSLFSAAFLVGVLLAVFGQVYQTGADPYSLFLGWAILILPWVIVGRQVALWMLLQALLNIVLITYWTQIVDPPDSWWQLSQVLGPLVWLSSTLMNSALASLVFALNVFALVVWEYATGRDISWAQGRTFPRIAAFGAIGNVMIPTVVLIFAASAGVAGQIGALSPVLYLAFSAAAIYYYQYRRPDLFILTVCAFAAVMVLSALFVRYLAKDSGGILLLAILLIGLVAGAAYWLRQVARRWERQS